MSNAQLRTLDTYVQLMNNNALAHVVRTAIRLGILEALSHGQKTIEQLAQLCDLQAAPLEVFLETLCHTGLIERYAENYALAQVALVLPRQFNDLGDRYWQHLESWIRNGTCVVDNDQSPLDERDYFAQYAASEWLATPAALDFAQVLDIGQSRRGLRVVDIACGSAIFSLTLVHQDPQSHVTLVDTAQQLVRARETAAGVDASDRVQEIEQDDPLLSIASEPFDLAILANVLRHQSRDRCAQVFKAVYQSLKPGGEIAIVDIFPGQEKGDVTRQVQHLELGLRTRDSQLHTAESLESMLKAQGFVEPRYAHLPSTPHIFGLMVAALPEH